jgi:hypothetical protein
MVSETVRPFKLESSEETFTAHVGLALFGEYCQGLGVGDWIDHELPAPGSGAGYAPSIMALAVVLTLHGGGRSLEDVRVVSADRGLLRLLDRTVPSPDALGDWLRRCGAGDGLAGLNRVHRRVLERLLPSERGSEHTLAIDATEIAAEKAAAKYTYTGEKGYLPMLGHSAETGLVLGERFREGNEAPAAGNLEFIRDCEAQLPGGHRIAAVRADSAAYRADFFNYCEANGKTFAIRARQDPAVKAVIEAILEADWQPWRDGEIAETLHCMDETHKAFRLVVVRRHSEASESDACRYRYTVVASNRVESAAASMRWYCQRGETSENRIKELKIGFGMERMPCGQFAANAMFLAIGVLVAYNLFKGFTRGALDTPWRRR